MNGLLAWNGLGGRFGPLWFKGAAGMGFSAAFWPLEDGLWGLDRVSALAGLMDASGFFIKLSADGMRSEDEDIWAATAAAAAAAGLLTSPKLAGRLK